MKDIGLFDLYIYNRGDGIRTHDLLVPNQALYQTEPRPDTTLISYIEYEKKARVFMKGIQNTEVNR